MSAVSAKPASRRVWRAVQAGDRSTCSSSTRWAAPTTSRPHPAKTSANDRPMAEVVPDTPGPGAPPLLRARPHPATRCRCPRCRARRPAVHLLAAATGWPRGGWPALVARCERARCRIMIESKARPREPGVLAGALDHANPTSDGSRSGDRLGRRNRRRIAVDFRALGLPGPVRVGERRDERSQPHPRSATEAPAEMPASFPEAEVPARVRLPPILRYRDGSDSSRWISCNPGRSSVQPD